LIRGAFDKLRTRGGVVLALVVSLSNREPVAGS
jgi:hypothetical protein